MGFGGSGDGSGSIGGASDAAVSLPADGQVLAYDGTVGKWKNTAPQTGFADPTTTKGDILIHADTTTRLGVGTDGQVLTADSAQTAGLAWAAPNIATVSVSTGSETRPDATTVLWIGGDTQPTNMQDGDLWFSPNPPADTQAPSVPMNVASSSVSTTSFTVSWLASTDNIGVTGYEVCLDGVSYAIVTGTSTSVAGRMANTTYNVTVRARDAAGNWSAFSDGLDVTTTESGSTDHSIWGTSVYPGLATYTQSPTITVATTFYTTASNWKVTGARLYVPVGITIASSCSVYIFNPGGTYYPDLSNPITTATLSVTAGQWNEVSFPSPVAVSANQQFWVGYEFSDGTYLSTTAIGSGTIAATDGSPLYLSADTSPSGNARNYYCIGTGPTQTSSISGQGYGVDVIVSEV